MRLPRPCLVPDDSARVQKGMCSATTIKGKTAPVTLGFKGVQKTIQTYNCDGNYYSSHGNDYIIKSG
eukprot:449972-Amphidinium_carterae.1